MLDVQLLIDLKQRDQLENNYNKIWVAYSGGVDSHVLLDLARRCFKQVHAIHINHGLHADDDLWQKHCMAICAQLDIPLSCISIATTLQPNQSYEIVARNARRKAWAEFLGPDDLLLLGHHADDQAETILYRLVRGSGANGLIGMREYSKIGAVSVLRPLLQISKQDIVAYALQHNLQWIVDQSNQNNNMDRNYLRNHIMPLLQQRWPAAISNINRAGVICTQLTQVMQLQVEEKLGSLLDANGALLLDGLQQLNQIWQHEVIRAWLKRYDIIPSMQHLKRLLQEVAFARVDAIPELRIKHKRIKRSNNKLYILDHNQHIVGYDLDWDLKQPLHLPNGQALEPKAIFNPALLDKLAQQRIKVRAGVWGRKAKKIFQQLAVPPWERGKYPLVFANERLVSIVGLWNSPRIDTA